MSEIRIEEVLTKLVAEYGLEVCKDVRKVKGLLSDHCGEKRREIKLLVMACEENIPQELLMLSETIPIEMTVKRLAKRMEDNCGTAEQAAQWTVGCWAAALGKLTPMQEDTIKPQAEELGKADLIAKPKAKQSGDDVIEKTGGLVEGEQDYISAFDRAQEYKLSLVSTMPPEVHASELGSLVGEAGESVEDSKFRMNYQTWPTGFKLVARHLGMPEIMQGAKRDYYGDFFFKEKEFTGSKLGEKLSREHNIYWRTGLEAQQAGNRFEAAFASKYEKELYHIGKTEHPLKYELGGLGIVGTPDFIGYDDQTDSMRIVDTKLAQADPYHKEYGLDIQKRAFSFKNQVQQMAYAYGFERMAKDTTESEWLSKMQEMTGHLKSKAPDEVTLLRMRKAALAGKFDIQLQPGTNEGGYQEYKPYQVFYGERQRAGVEEIAEKIYGDWFEPKAFKRAAGLLYQSLSEGAMPNAISAAYTFGEKKFDPKEYKLLHDFAFFILKLADGVEMEFVHFPAGEFVMGSEGIDDAPPHKVYLDEYWMGKTPVTNQQYQCFIDANPQHRIPYIDDVWAKKYNWDQKTRQHPTGRSNHPVVLVNWHDALAFSQWAGCRLPTEAEWEKAARGTDGREYPWGNSEPDKNLCNYNENVGDTTKVGAYHPQGDSAYGCSDMAGNVWEWVSDWYGREYYRQSPYSNPTGPETGNTKVLRGGCWYNYGKVLRLAYRYFKSPTTRYNCHGFRCVISPGK